MKLLIISVLLISVAWFVQCQHEDYADADGDEDVSLDDNDENSVNDKNKIFHIFHDGENVEIKFKPAELNGESWEFKVNGDDVEHATTEDDDKNENENGYADSDSAYEDAEDNGLEDDE